MDIAQAPIPQKVTKISKAAHRWESATTTITNALDTVSPAFVPFAQRWDAERDRRDKLRTPEHLRDLLKAQAAYNTARTAARQAKTQRSTAADDSRNPLSTARRAARSADRAARKQVASARSNLKAAKKNHPETLTRRAVELHAAHAVPAAAASCFLSTPHDWTVWPASISAGLIGLNVVALWLGRRQVEDAPAYDLDGLVPTEEEERLLARLETAHWTASPGLDASGKPRPSKAAARGLDGLVPGEATLTESGIVCPLRMDGTWTLAKVRAAEDNIRALIGARTGLRLTISAGRQGDWAEVKLLTRSAAGDGVLLWNPGAPSFGVDMTTGEEVTIALGQRLLIAGMSGAGKSVASRPLLFDASEGALNALVIIDLKQVEGRLWDHRARVASAPEAVLAVVAELVAEMHERLAAMPKGMDTWQPTPDRPRITVVVDEGAEVVSVSKDAVEGLETLARMGRAALIDLWWMTQKPTMSGTAAGIPAQIAPQLSTRISLAVSTPTEARTVLGEDAQAKGWNAEELPKPGVALVRDGKRQPNPVKVRYMDKAVVIALPDQPIWSRSTGHGGGGGDGGTEAVTLVLDRPALELVKADPTGEASKPATAAEDVLNALASGPLTQKDITEATGRSKGRISEAVKALLADGAVKRLDDGRIARAGKSA